MSGHEFVLQVFNGVTFAALLFLLASGFTLIFGLMNIMNLAHGSFYLVGGYLALSAVRFLTSGGAPNILSFLLSVIFAACVIAVFGALIERGLLRRVRGLTLAEVLLTVGLVFAFGDIALAVWTGDPQQVPAPSTLTGSVNLFGFIYPTFRFVIVFLGIFVGIALWYLQAKTRFGAVIRAGVDDREMVDALGIDIRTVFNRVFAFGALLAAIAGVFGGALLGLYPGADWEILVYALVVVILGGPGSLLGAVVGSLTVGLTDAFAKTLIPDLVYFTVFAPMALILVFRPYGLFGRQA